MLNTLSGRFLILTAAFVMLAEVLIFVPSVARFRVDYLLSRLERAQIASLALLADDMISPELEAELLQNAEVYNVVLVRDQTRILALSSAVPDAISATYDLRDATPTTLIADAMGTLLDSENQVIRVRGAPVREGGELIEVTMPQAPLRMAMIDYGVRILVLSAVISIFTAVLLFLAARMFIVRPIRGVVDAMQSYASAPEDGRRIIMPTAGVKELRAAEDALQSLQTQLTGALRQKERLAQLGSAVAKISHDLRNVLTTAQLFADRIESSTDPAVARMAPKLLNSISRAISICEGALTFGKAEEPPPQLSHVMLADLVSDVLEGERLAAGEADISFSEDVPAGMTLRADSEQLYRVLGNLVRNARQAMESKGLSGEIGVAADETDDEWTIRVTDTGPGLPPRVQEHLFQPFQSASKKGTGLGLTIARDLVRGHGGDLWLANTGADGTTFQLCFPKTVMSLD
ncbi:Phytochrome-like protein cph1 [Rhodobacteraceae bacterium THAF1]|uniref:sensor histidine kinase n=1 Tax=Palleronia sp. THAF1 TaxID=2587842 RepID=UPI000F3DC1F6|nr:HAMP domain-containing sensor histidine kinase [Palleronia sp. THAF1]QFU07684.1 Phytochrome-like protein cph1 [Palleronia sp. THAF1]VDC23139.1 Phytochrome-like protein cph1 [Rhodobacteraceae bacterium THAF1]